MAERVRIPVTAGILRRMAVVAEAAAQQGEREMLGRTQENALRAFSTRVLAALTEEAAVEVFGGGESEAVACHVETTTSGVREYLRTLDDVASLSPTPHERQSCKRVFAHLLEHVDAEDIGLRPERFETLRPEGPSPIYG